MSSVCIPFAIRFFLLSTLRSGPGSCIANRKCVTAGPSAGRALQAVQNPPVCLQLFSTTSRTTMSDDSPPAHRARYGRFPSESEDEDLGTVEMEEQQQQVPQQPEQQQQERRPQANPPRGGQSSHGDQGSDSTRGRTEVSEEEDFEEVLIIDSEHLIHLVQERPALWDQSDSLHANNQATQRLWKQICSIMVNKGNRYVWEELHAKQQKKFGIQIKTRWNSIRDRMIRDFGEEEHLPSGSGVVTKRPYRYAKDLQFLRKSNELRKTSSNIRRQTGPSTGGLDSGTRENVAAQPAIVPLPESSPAEPSTPTIAVGSGLVGHRVRPGRRRQSDLEGIIEATTDTLVRLDQQMTGLKKEMDRLVARQERAVPPSTGPPSSSRLFLESLVDDLERLTLDQQLEFRRFALAKLAELHARPPSQPYYPPQPYKHPQPYYPPQPYNQPYHPPQSYSQPYNQPYNQPQPYNQTQPYNQPQSYSQPQPYNQPQPYHPPQQ